MPEPNFLSLYSFTPEPPKKAPIIKLSCGIGDTDGFPAFDVDSEQYAAKDDSKWGFLITGGAEFHMPLTVFQVTPDGLADKGGICLGDIILEINEEDATHLTLAQAHEKIDASGKKIHFLVKSMDDEEPMDGYEPGEERSIVLRVPKPLPPPKVSSIEKRLQDLQRKLSEIAEIPKILSSTLATVSQTFDKLTTNLPPSATSANCRHHCQNGNDYFDGNEQKRKMSYDEDVYDYELSDEADGGDTGAKEEFDAKETYLQLKRYAARHRKTKEETPESDYASESNYPQKQTANKNQDDMTSDNDVDSDENNDVTNDDYNYNYNDSNNNNTSANVTFKAVDDDDSDVEKSSDMYENFNLSVLKIPLGHVDNESDTDEYEEDDDEETDIAAVGDVDGDDDDDEEDFLTTTFTWNLRNKPKLQINHSYDNYNDNDNDNINKPDNDNSNNDEDDDKFNVSQEKSFKESKDMLCQRQQYIKSETPEKEQKLDKLERSWPWADREKIIYKQSTCHLVPQKPLGLIEQRIQLLAKRNLLEHLNKTKNP